MYPDFTTQELNNRFDTFISLIEDKGYLVCIKGFVSEEHNKTFIEGDIYEAKVHTDNNGFPYYIYIKGIKDKEGYTFYPAFIGNDLDRYFVIRSLGDIRREKIKNII